MSDIGEIIKQSSFQIIGSNYVYVKVKEFPKSRHFMVSQDADEITVITTDNRLAEIELIEKNKETYTLISLNVSVPFYAVGFLASVSKAIADQGLNILIVSTYSKDYILVKTDFIDTAIKALIELGFQEK